MLYSINSAVYILQIRSGSNKTLLTQLIGVVLVAVDGIRPVWILFVASLLNQRGTTFPVTGVSFDTFFAWTNVIDENNQNDFNIIKTPFLSSK